MTVGAKDLLLEEYRYFADSFWKNEQTGETRVNWFIGIVTAAAAGLVGLSTAQHRPEGERLRLIFVGVLFALLAFGLMTLVAPKNAGEWIFPKGHIDRGEECWQAAVREVREETGVLAQVICMAGRDEFKAGDERVISKYYLMEYFVEVTPNESRRVGWFEFDEALTLLTHVQNKHLLQEAERKRRSISKETLLLSNSQAVN